MTRVRAFSVGVLATITVAVVVHGDLLWLAYMLASNIACLAIGLLANLASHPDPWRDFERRPPQEHPMTVNLTERARRVWRTPPPPATADSYLVECARGHDTVRWSKTVGRRCWLCNPEDWTGLA